MQLKKIVVLSNMSNARVVIHIIDIESLTKFWFTIYTECQYKYKPYMYFSLINIQTIKYFANVS